MEGIGAVTPVIIAPMQDHLAYDIAIPLAKPHLIHNDRKISTLDPAAFEAIYDQTDLEETFRINLKLEFATTETEVHQADLAVGAVPMAQELLRSVTNKVLQRAKLPMALPNCIPWYAPTWHPAALGRRWTWTARAYARTCGAWSCKKASPGTWRGRLQR